MPLLFGNEPFEQRLHLALVQCLHAFAFEQNPIIIKAGQEFAAIQRHLRKQFTCRSIRRFARQLRDVEPMFGIAVERNRQFVREQIIAALRFLQR